MLVLHFAPIVRLLKHVTPVLLGRAVKSSELAHSCLHSTLCLRLYKIAQSLGGKASEGEREVETIDSLANRPICLWGKKCHDCNGKSVTWYLKNLQCNT